MAKKYLKIKILSAILIVGSLGIGAYFYKDFNYKKVNNKMYFLGKMNSNNSCSVSVYNNGKIYDLGTSLYGFVDYLPSYNEYLLQEPVGDKYNLELVKVGGNKENLGSFGDSYNNIFYKDGYVAVLNSKNEFTIIDINSKKTYSLDLNNETNSISRIIDGNVFYLDQNQNFCEYSLLSRKNKILFGKENNFYVDTVEDAGAITFISSNGTLGQFDIKSGKFTVLDKDILPISLQQLSNQNSLGVSKVATDSEGDIAYIYNYGNSQNALIYKAKNSTPIIIEANLINFEKVGNDYFYNTKVDGKIEEKVYSLGGKSKLLPIQNIQISSIGSMSKDEFYGLTLNNNDLYSFDINKDNKTLIAGDVDGVTMQGNELIYAKQISDENNMSRFDLYDIYVNGKLLEKDVISCSISGNKVFYINNQGEFFVVDDGKAEKENLNGFQVVQVIKNKSAQVLSNYNLYLQPSEISGYWMRQDKGKEEFYRINEKGYKEITNNAVSYNGFNFTNETTNTSDVALGSESNKIIKLTLMNQDEMKDSLGGVWMRIPKSKFESIESEYIEKYGYLEIVKRFFANENTKVYSLSQMKIDGEEYFLVKDNEKNREVIMNKFGEFFNYSIYKTSGKLVVENGWLYTGVKQV
ncbi:MAG: hypothetical protein ACRCWM_11545 [Sarcina sp.]